jgi:hypothetical protein
MPTESKQSQTTATTERCERIKENQDDRPLELQPLVSPRSLEVNGLPGLAFDFFTNAWNFGFDARNSSPTTINLFPTLASNDQDDDILELDIIQDTDVAT